MKIRRLLVLLLAALFIIAPLGGCGSQKEKKEQFIVGFDAEFPPYGYQDENGEYVGFDLSLAQEVSDRLGMELVKKPVDWDAKDQELATGAISCIWNGFSMNGREDNYTWSKPYVDNSQVVVVKEDSGIQTLDDLAGKNMMVQVDSSALAALTGEGATEANKALTASLKDLSQIADYSTAFMMLESGAVDAVALDVGVADYQLSNRKGFVKLDAVLASENYAIGFRKGNTELRDKVQKALDDMAADGTFLKIAQEWGVDSAICFGK